MSSRFVISLAVGLLVLWACGQAPRTPQAPQTAPAKAKNLQVLDPNTPLAVVDADMKTMAAGLGVECSFCHVPGAYEKDDVDMKLVARRMMRMVNAMNDGYFSGRAEISCYTCHRGQRLPLRHPPRGGQ
jgi:photosynthetic reaction center cytochrome c subunit